MDEMFSSVMSQYLKPLTLDLPLSKGDQQDFSIRTISKERTKYTISQIIKIQQTFPLSVIPFMIYYLILGFLLAYLSMTIFVLSLLNLILFFMLVGTGWKYINWTITSITTKKMKKQIHNIKSFLLKQNKQYYSKKLIRWAYDQDLHQIVVHNLRQAF